MDDRSSVSSAPMKAATEPKPSWGALLVSVLGSIGVMALLGCPAGTNLGVVRTVADLRATIGTGTIGDATNPPTVVTLQGHSTPGDGGGGLFSWDSGTTADDGGTLIHPTGGSGSWRRLYDGPVNVRWFGAKGDGSTPDQVAINAAVNAAAPSGDGLNVFFPTGTYRLTSTIRADRDGLTLTGGPDAVLLVDPPPPGNLESYPEALLVAQNGGATTTHRVVIEGLTFQVKGGSDNTGGSAGVIQLNNCADCVVRHVRVVRDPSVNVLPAGVDGIVMAAGSIGGLIQGCTVDGMAKVGIYLPPNVVGSPNTSYTRIDTSEVRNMNGTIGAVGIGIGAEHVVVSNCQAHDNLGSGLLIQTIGLTPPRAPGDIQIIGGHYDANHVHGIDVNTAYSAIPNNIQVNDVNTSYNWQNGIVVENATNVVISGPTVAYNRGAGMVIGSSGASRVQVINPTVFDNGSSAAHLGIGISSRADSITIAGGRLYDDLAVPAQLYGIQLIPDSGRAPTNIRILDVDCDGANSILQNALVVTAPNGAEAASGFYRIQHAGNPEDAAPFSAPVGSQYVNTTSGVLWVRVPDTNFPWEQVVTQ